MRQADEIAIGTAPPAVPTDTTPEPDTQTTTDVPAIEAVNTGATPTTPAPPRSPFANEPYEYDRCTIAVTLQFWPSDDQPGGRRILISARNYQDKPILLLVREQALGPLPDAVTSLLEQLRAELPERARAHAEAEAQEREKQAQVAARHVGVNTKRSKRGAERSATEPEPMMPISPPRTLTTAQPTTSTDQLHLFTQL